MKNHSNKSPNCAPKKDWIRLTEKMFGQLASVMVIVLASTLCRAADVYQMTNSCYATGGQPNSFFHLPFCGEVYSGKRCCPSQVDLQNRETYMTLTMSDSATCGPADPVVYRSMSEIRHFMCLPCDPQEPTFRYLQRDGDLHLGGQAPPNDEADPDEWGWRICQSFIFGKDRKSGLWGVDGDKFNKCGYSAVDCKNVVFLEYDNETESWLRHFPGPCDFINDDTAIFPGRFYDGTELQKAALVLQDVWSAVDDFAFYFIDDYDPSYRFEDAPCFGRNDVPLTSLRISMAIVCIVAASFFFLPVAF